ncbi:MAG: TIGR00725 family protein [Pyrinomonadaceae bacterium]|nr:TIGR00725 family protein [Pyrinomonadaceae bacterium]
MSRIIVGVMGAGRDASAEAREAAFELGRLIAREGWILLTGGRNAGVMDAASRGAKEAQGLTVGILPGKDTEGMSDAVDIPIFTGMGQARNNINVLSSRLVFACGIGAGTASEIALALKAGKKVILLCCNQEGIDFFRALGKENVLVAAQPDEAVLMAKKLMLT